MIVWATGFDFGTGALARMGIRGREGRALVDHWADGPKTFLGIQTSGFPNFYFPGGPHAAAGNNPRYNGDQVEFVTDMLLHLRATGCDAIEVDEAAEEKWTAMVDRWATKAPAFGESSYYFGTNIPGKPRKYLLNSAGRPKLLADIAKVRKPTTRPSRCRSAPGAGSGPPKPDLAPARSVQTVATGVNGEPTTPGSRSGGAVSRNRLRSCSRSQVASSWRYHISPSGTPSLKRQRL